MPSSTLATVGLAAGALVAALGLVAGGLYIADYGVEATIVEKNCPEVVAETHVGGFEVTREVQGVSCAVVQPGDIVVYHIRSGDLEYEPQGNGVHAVHAPAD
jgi:hypothetical protein